MPLPVAGDRRRVDRDAFALLDRIEVRMGGAVMDLADAMDAPRVEQHPFGQRGLAGIDVSDDARVSDAIYVVAISPGHKTLHFGQAAASAATVDTGAPG